MTQLHMPSRRESSVIAMWEKTLYTALILGVNFQGFKNLNVGEFQNVGCA